MGKKIFITGGSGYLGAHFIKTAIHAGHELTLLMRETSTYKTINTIHGHKSWLDHVNIVKTSTLENLIDEIMQSNPDCFVHMAATGGYAHTPKDISKLVQANITIGTAILEAAHLLKEQTATRKPVVYCGSYWQHSGSNSEPWPNSLYAATKSAFEEIARYYGRVLAEPVVGLKFYDIYGPNDDRNKLVNLLIKSLNADTTLKLSAGAQNIRFLEISDAVAAIFHALNHIEHTPFPKLSYGVYGHGLISIKNLIDLISEISERSPKVDLGALSYREREIFHPVKLDLLPDWQAQISLRTGIQNILNT